MYSKKKQQLENAVLQKIIVIFTLQRGCSSKGINNFFYSVYHHYLAKTLFFIFYVLCHFDELIIITHLLCFVCHKNKIAGVVCDNYVCFFCKLYSKNPQILSPHEPLCGCAVRPVEGLSDEDVNSGGVDDCVEEELHC